MKRRRRIPCFKDAVAVQEKEGRDDEVEEIEMDDIFYDEAREKVNESLQLLKRSPLKYARPERNLSLGDK